MRALPLVLLLCLGAAVPAAQGEEPPKGNPTGPFKAERDGADAVQRALEKGAEAKGLAALIPGFKTDPWLVVEELCLRGKHDAAAALAKAAPEGIEYAKLAAYVQAHRAFTEAASDRKLVEGAAAAFAKRDVQSVLDLTAEAAKGSLETVTRTRLLYMRSVAHRALRQLRESSAAARTGGDAALALGWLARASALFQAAGVAAYQASDPASALSAWQALAAVEKERGREDHGAGAQANIGLVQEALGRYDDALASYRSAIKRFEALGDRRRVAGVMSNIGNVHQSRGELEEALAAHEQTLVLHTEFGNAVGVARTTGNIANIHLIRGDYVTALAKQKEALELQKAVGDKPAVARTLGNIGLVQAALGNYTKALATYERSQQQKDKLQDKAGIAGTLINMAASYAALGRYAEAMAALERGLALAKEAKHRQWIVNALANMGSIHFELGDEERALSANRRALAEMEAMGDQVGAARAYENLGLTQMAAGDIEDALASFAEARKRAAKLGVKARAASAITHVAEAQFQLGRRDEAIATFQQAIEAAKEIGNRPGETRARLGLGRALLEMGRIEEARDELERGRRTARSIRATPLFVRGLVGLAALEHKAGNMGRALSWAREALNATEKLLGGLAEGEGATARSRHTELFSIGALAAIKEDDLAEALTFLESGRAGALLDIMDRREHLRWKAETLPPELLKADRLAHDTLRIRRQQYDRAVREGKRKATRAAQEALDLAAGAVHDMSARIQRELKQQAGLFYPRPKPIEELQEALKPHQALVMYGLCVDTAVAFVLRPEEARVVSLGTVTEVVKAVEALDATDVDTDPTPALDALRASLVAPLELPAEVKQVLVSPEGALCYVPFQALFQRPVAMTPSGTTHALLLEQERIEGKGILALGDPEYGGVSAGALATYYRGRKLTPLPASRKEVEGIGTVKLLGADANEEALGAALPKSTQWRAIHFACHGTVNPARPRFSSLVLSKTERTDGFLMLDEIRWMRFPTDLTVLSACETARGLNAMSEGIVGLTRNFMHAGSPRVICSLWKVDDAATQALMLKFYELWNPKEGQGLGAAEALAKAQDHVRAQEKWKHPYYWAAWALWGLPE